MDRRRRELRPVTDMEDRMRNSFIEDLNARKVYHKNGRPLHELDYAELKWFYAVVVAKND